MLSALHDPCKAGQAKPAASAQALRARPSARILAFPGATRTSHVRPAWDGETSPGFAGAPAGGAPPASTPVPHGTAQCVPADAATCLTVADRIALLAWTSQGSAGYARVVLEDGVPGGAPDRGSYVLLYRPHDLWAVIGMTRRAAGIMVWRCSDGSARGDYPTMAEALAALPPARPQN